MLINWVTSSDGLVPENLAGMFASNQIFGMGNIVGRFNRNILKDIFGRGSGFGLEAGGRYGVGCVITPETPEYVCSKCGRSEGLLRNHLD